MKFDRGGKMLFSTYLGSVLGNGTTGVSSAGIAVDGAGNVYVTGSTDGTNFPLVHPLISYPPPDGSGMPAYHAFVAKLNPTGSKVLHSTYLGGDLNSGGSAITVDQAGTAYVVGSTAADENPDNKQFPVTAHKRPCPPGTDGFVAVISPTGAQVCFTVGYEDAVYGASYQITMYDHTGKVRNVDPQSFQGTSGYDSTCFSDSLPLEPGDYFLGLGIDGSTIAITNFSIEPSRVVVTTFYTLPAGAVNCAGAPPRSGRYRAGITLINYYFHFRGIALDQLNYAISIVAPAGVRLVLDTSGGSAINHSDTASSGWILSSVSVRKPFPPGVYKLELVMNGQALAFTGFTVI